MLTRLATAVLEGRQSVRRKARRKHVTKFRELFGIRAEDYLLTLCGDFGYLEFISNSCVGPFSTRLSTTRHPRVISEVWWWFLCSPSGPLYISASYAP